MSEHFETSDELFPCLPYPISRTNRRWRECSLPCSMLLSVDMHCNRLILVLSLWLNLLYR